MITKDGRGPPDVTAHAHLCLPMGYLQIFSSPDSFSGFTEGRRLSSSLIGFETGVYTSQTDKSSPFFLTV